MRDKKVKEVEQQIHTLQQQLKTKDEKQKEKDEYESKLNESLECCRQLKIQKLQQFDALIEQQGQDKEERQRHQEHNKIADKKYKHNMTEMTKARAGNQLSEKKKLKQLDMLLQQQEHYQKGNE